jgi:hypothetical protein
MEVVGTFIAILAFVAVSFMMLLHAIPRSVGISGMVAAVCIGILSLALGPYYNVWQQGLSGAAQLKRAEQNRKIRIQEAQAAFESAKLTAKAEVEQARGAAEANKIMAQSLGGPEAYLRWKYINMLEQKRETERTVIYVPTEAQIPITEATRFKDQASN